MSRRAAAIRHQDVGFYLAIRSAEGLYLFRSDDALLSIGFGEINRERLQFVAGVLARNMLAHIEAGRVDRFLEMAIIK